MPKGCLKVYAVRFVEPPPVGTAIELPDGQAYRVVRHQPGFAPTVWRTRCLETGIEFEFATGLTVTGLSRRPPRPPSSRAPRGPQPGGRRMIGIHCLPTPPDHPVYIYYIYIRGGLVRDAGRPREDYLPSLVLKAKNLPANPREAAGSLPPSRTFPHHCGKVTNSQMRHISEVLAVFLARLARTPA
jgi:hypothetical protein